MVSYLVLWKWQPKMTWMDERQRQSDGKRDNIHLKKKKIQKSWSSPANQMVIRGRDQITTSGNLRRWIGSARGNKPSILSQSAVDMTQQHTHPRLLSFRKPNQSFPTETRISYFINTSFFNFKDRIGNTLIIIIY